MTSRISNLASSNLLLSHMLRTQARLEDGQSQVSTGKVSQDYLGITREAQGLLISETSLSLYQDYIRSNDTADIRMGISEVTMSSMQQTMNDFRKILKSLTSGGQDEDSIKDAQTWAFRALKDMESYLNTEADGRYLYSGTRATTLPVELGLDTLDTFQTTYDGYRTTYATTRDAHLADFSLDKDTKTTAQYTDTDNWLIFRRDGDSDPTTSSSSRIDASATGQFSGLKAGATITLSDTASNNGTYTIESVASDGSYIDVVTTMLTDEAFDDGFNTESLTAAHTGQITLADSTNVTDAAGDFTFDPAAQTITVTVGTPFSDASAGETIVVSGTGSNNGTYTIDSIGGGGNQITVRATTTATITPRDGAAVAYADTGNLVFDRSADTITATTASAFSDVEAGQEITVAGTTQNNGDYMVKSVSADGKTITIESKKLTDEGVDSGDTFFDYTAGTQTVFNKAAGTITAQNYAGTNMAETFAGLEEDDTFTITGTGVTPKLYTEVVFADNGAGDVDTIQVVANDGTTPVVGYFHGVNVGDTVNVAGATVGANDAAYVVNWVSEDGSQIRVDTGINTAATDTASITFTGTTITNFTTKNHLEFADGGGGDDIIYMRDDGGAAIAAAFDDMSVGMTVTVANAPLAANNGTFTITAVNSAGGYITVQKTDGTDAGLAAGTSQTAPETTISTNGNDGTYTVQSVTNNGATIVVDSTTPLIADQTDKNGTVVADSTRGFTYTAGTKLVISDGGTSGVAGDDTITIKNITTGSADAEALKGVRAGHFIKLTGTDNDGTYKIKTVDASTGKLTLDTAIAGVSGTFVPNPGATASIQIFAADGKIEADSYYKGDSVTLNHRLDPDRSIDPNVIAIDPAFEKALRAMSIIAQGAYGTKGGLDQNLERIDNALYLLDDALGKNPSGTPPYGDETSGDIESLQRDLAFNRLVLQQTNKRHETLSVFMENRITKIENIDKLEAISKMLEDTRVLEASYQSLSRIKQLSLINFL